MKNEEVNIESLLRYIRQFKRHNKKEWFTGEVAMRFIEVKLLECRLNFIDKKLCVVIKDGR